MVPFLPPWRRSTLSFSSFLLSQQKKQFIVVKCGLFHNENSLKNNKILLRMQHKSERKQKKTKLTEVHLSVKEPPPPPPVRWGEGADSLDRYRDPTVSVVRRNATGTCV